jgi:hypothetical protein
VPTARTVVQGPAGPARGGTALHPQEKAMTKHSVRHGAPAGVAAEAVGARAIGAQAIGSIGVAALALGALAIGALAIGRLAIGRARIRRLEIDELVVRRLRVIDGEAPVRDAGQDP